MSRFAISHVLGVNDQPKVVFEDSVSQQSCDIYLFGCTVTSWKVKGEEKLFLSELAVFNGVKAIRGGIPLVFPQFGQPSNTMPQHGFARTSLWSFKNTETEDDSCTAYFTLSDTSETLAVWPHKFILTYAVTLSNRGLSTKLVIHNTDTASFECQALLHTYIRIPDIHSCQVTGFKDCPYFDKMQNNNHFIDHREVATIDQEVDRIYAGDLTNSRTIGINHLAEGGESKSLLTVDYSSHITYHSSEPISQPTDCVLWNAWIEKTASIADLNNDAYLSYVCVEPGVVNGYLTVESSKVLTLSQCLVLPQNE